MADDLMSRFLCPQCGSAGLHACTGSHPVLRDAEERSREDRALRNAFELIAQAEQIERMRTDHADALARKDAEIAELRKEVAELDGIRMELDGLRALYEERTAYTVVHRGAGIACSDSMRQAYSDQTIRAERAEARVSEAPVARVERWAGGAWVLHKRDLEIVHPPIVGKRIALVLLDEKKSDADTT